MRDGAEKEYLGLLEHLSTLRDHRAKLTEWFASDAYKAFDGILEKMQGVYRETVFSEKKTQAEREDARAIYIALGKVRQMPAFISESLEIDEAS